MQEATGRWEVRRSPPRVMALAAHAVSQFPKHRGMEPALKVVVVSSGTEAVSSGVSNAIKMERGCPTVPRKVIPIDPRSPTAAHGGFVPRSLSVPRGSRLLGELPLRLDDVAFGVSARTFADGASLRGCTSD